MESICKINIVCSYIGYLILNGNVEAIKFLYGTAWREHPALIKTIDHLQGYLTSVEIVNDTNGLYSMEFLYFWGMICLGELSSLIAKNLETAKTCFRKIRRSVPQAEARLAYIGLLKSTEPAKSDCNVCRLEALRQCANRQRDLFSMIALAKICFYSFLEEQQANDPDIPITTLPMKAMRLLELPCHQGHPVAIRFWNEMMGCIESTETTGIRYDEKSIRQDVLYDFKTSANMQIRL